MRKPLIGITCDDETKYLGDIPRFFQQLNDSYVKAVEEAGGIPLVIPNGLKEEKLKQLAEDLDGFLFSGGVDVDPGRYGQEKDETVVSVSKKRDETEFTLLKHVLDDTKKPVLCICRGMQMLNAALGGTLIQDLEKAGYEKHFLIDNPRNVFTHEIVVEEDSKLKKILKDEIRVNSFHHQALGEVSERLKVTAHSKKDHVIEAAEMPGERFVLAVQWHPEELIANGSHLALFKEFVSQAEK